MENKVIPPTPCCCGFCGRTRDQVQKLIRGRVGGFPSYICDGCVEEIYLDLGLGGQPLNLAPKKIFKLTSLFPERVRGV
jgi:hypothetical protein